MKILLLPRFNDTAASSRYRLGQYVPLLKQAGHQVTVKPMLSDRYIARLYSRERRDAWQVVQGYWRRLKDLLTGDRYDVVICEQEVFPYLPAWADQMVRRLGDRLVLDYDDAAYVKYQRWPLLRSKIPRLLASARAVVVGNAHLEEFARRHNSNVYVVPTTVDLALYRPKKEFSKGTVRVVWIGTPITAHNLLPLLPVFGRLQRANHSIHFRFIGARGRLSFNGLRAEVVNWSAETETRLLEESDIGIMPLPDNEFTRGKCGLKLIQYMASGLPVVASPVGANCEIVEEGRNGFLARTDGEWFEKLGALADDVELRRRLGVAGREKVNSQYSLAHGFSCWTQILKEVTS